MIRNLKIAVIAMILTSAAILLIGYPQSFSFISAKPQSNKIYAANFHEGIITGELKKWHRVTISFHGPAARENDNKPNPFLDYRLQVFFTGPSGQIYNVPGFFDGDGEGNGVGDIWRVHFSPDEGGLWTYQVSFRMGPGVAVETDPNSGKPTSFDGSTGSFNVAALNPNSPGFLKWGRLEYVAGYYLKFRDGPYWIKGGSDSPENFLAYQGFDNTSSGSEFGLHDYRNHIQDWKPGDVDWGNGKGKGIIGALNYLAGQHVNSIYFLPMNIGGDGQDTWPFVGSIDPIGNSSNDNLHYDISKLFQWEIVFSHAQKLGIVLHFVLNEGEAANKRELDNATLGPERKLYYRELIARFGHHNALQWNLCEEYNYDLALDPEMVKQWAAYLKALDPYQHPVTVHNTLGGVPARILPQDAFAPFLGDRRIDLLSVQYRPDQFKPMGESFGDMVESLREGGQEAHHPLAVFIDEANRVKTVDDESHEGKFPMLSGQSYIRKVELWPVYLSGGDGIEYILEGEPQIDDFRPFENMWKYTWYARKFMEENLPFWRMQPMDHLVVGGVSSPDLKGQVLAKEGEVYAIYLPSAQYQTRLDLSGTSGRYIQRWFNPRAGRFDGGEATVYSGKVINLGTPPNSSSDDWVILLKAASPVLLPNKLKEKR